MQITYRWFPWTTSLTLALLGCSSASFSASEGPSADTGTGADVSVDTSTSDSGNVDSNTPDLSAEAISSDDATASSTACKGKKDGEECTIAGLKGRICLDKECVPSRCGDGIVDLKAGEECDDKSPGCDALCNFRCKEAKNCDDSNPCTEDACDVTKHTCAPPKSVAGTPACTDADGKVGRCDAGFCKKASCGNGFVDDGEECDDKSPGCKPDCKFVCKADKDCALDDLCLGVSTCNLTTHTCSARTPVTCTSDDCRKGACNPVSGKCEDTYLDTDGDGESCTTDCDDKDAKRSTRFSEGCAADGIDNNCDGKKDNLVGAVTCYADRDGDGFPEISSTVTGCTCPVNTRPARIDGIWDCADGEANAYPGSTNYYTSGYSSPSGLPFDYDCDGRETPQYTFPVETCIYEKALACTERATSKGWVSAPPACGETAKFGNGCKWVISGLSGYCTIRETTEVTMPCK